MQSFFAVPELKSYFNCNLFRGIMNIIKFPGDISQSGAVVKHDSWCFTQVSGHYRHSHSSFKLHSSYGKQSFFFHCQSKSRHLCK